MCLFPKKFSGRLIPVDSIPLYYSKNGILFETKTNKMVKKKELFSEKQKYISAYLDGYFSDKKTPYGFKYFSELKNATKKATKKWKKEKHLR